MDNYLIAKTFHILGAVIFLGNIVVTALWKILADKTRNPTIIAYSQRLVTFTDFVFTVTGVVLIYITGKFFLSDHFQESGHTSWLNWGEGLFVLSGLLWLLVLIPVQVKQSRLASTFDDIEGVPRSYRKLSTIWNSFGTIAIILPLVTLYFMVMKPA